MEHFTVGQPQNYEGVSLGELLELASAVLFDYVCMLYHLYFLVYFYKVLEKYCDNVFFSLCVSFPFIHLTGSGTVRSGTI